MGLGGSLIGWHSAALPASDSIKLYEKIKIAPGFIALDRTKGTGEENKVTFFLFFFPFLFFFFFIPSRRHTSTFPRLNEEGRLGVRQQRRDPFCCA